MSITRSFSTGAGRSATAQLPISAPAKSGSPTLSRGIRQTSLTGFQSIRTVRGVNSFVPGRPVLTVPHGSSPTTKYTGRFYRDTPLVANPQFIPSPIKASKQAGKAAPTVKGVIFRGTGVRLAPALARNLS